MEIVQFDFFLFFFLFLSLGEVAENGIRNKYFS